MSHRFREISVLYGVSAALTALLALPPALALWGWPDLHALQILQQRLVGIERGVGFALLTLCLILWFVRRVARLRRERDAVGQPNADALVSKKQSRAEDGSHKAHGPALYNEGASAARRAESDSRTARRALLLTFPAIFAPALPLLIYLWHMNQLAYANLFLGDQDFTNISTAINQTAQWRGFLTTPFLETGPTGSYLGHHFSPLLALYAPAYWLAGTGFLADAGDTRSTHQIYAVCLWATLALGLLLWARLIQREIRGKITAVACMAVFCGAFPLWRLALSYHYELPVIPLSALTFLALARWRNGRLNLWFWFWLLLWMANKEDIALYVGLFAVYLASDRGEAPDAAPLAHLTRALGVGVFALAWLLLALLAMDWIGGPERVDWVQMWSEPTPYSERSLRPGLFLLLSFALIPALKLRYFALMLLPLLVFHYLSQQVWHHNYLGHYSYAILPFLGFGLIRGLRRLENGFDFWREARGDASTDSEPGGRNRQTRGRESVPATVLIAALACSFLAAGSDRYMPLPRLNADPRFATVEAMLQKLPTGACLQTQSPFSAHAPLDVQVFPLMIPQKNPAHTTMPGPHNFERFYFRERNCRGYYLLLDSGDPMPPFYSQEHLTAFVQFAERNLERVPFGDRNGISNETSEADPAPGLRMYRLGLY